MEHFLKQALLLDLETAPDGHILAGAAMLDDEAAVMARPDQWGVFDSHLTVMASRAACVLGHNIALHDLPLLAALAPRSRVLRLPVVDTLLLSPLAFPENPYHRLVKDYKLVRTALNDPAADARNAASLFRDEWAALARLGQAEPGLPQFYREAFERSAALADNTRRGLRLFFDALDVPQPTPGHVPEWLRTHLQELSCATALEELLAAYAQQAAPLPALLYAVAWLRVAGHNSVLPPWVRQEFPEVSPLIQRLRDAPCNRDACAYCRAHNDPRAELRRFFSLESFRPEPQSAEGGSLQEQIVCAGLRREPLLAVMPTGAGKSLCYQLPALVRHWRRGVLTVVISPLQALMKDQVDNLLRRTGAPMAAALNGLLTSPERGEVLARLRLGDLALLYVSPEQLRNRSFREAVRQREIGAWVFDEAHCLSKWGHAFRPDYLYASRYIKELALAQKTEAPPPVCCFTATARQDVIAEIMAHFREELGQTLVLYGAGAERTNLAFEVQLAPAPQKWPRVHELLRARLPEGGAAVVYAATRKGAEALSEYLRQQGWPAGVYHAGLRAPDKRRIQEEFIAGQCRVICATNAFGMGIDKDNIRLIIHADIPGSLENYVQEAGRAGRDLREAECVLLYDEHDVEQQFSLNALTQLSPRDVAQILKGLRSARRQHNHEIVITAGELLSDEQVDTSFNASDPDAGIRTRSAIALLERGGFVERNENRTRVFQGRPLVRDMEAARQRIGALNLSETTRRQWLAVFAEMLNAPPDEPLNADQLAELPVLKESAPAYQAGGVRSDSLHVMRILNDMAEAGLIKRDMRLTAFVRHKVLQPSTQRLADISQLEAAMLRVMREAEPDPEGWLALSLPALNQCLLDEQLRSAPEILRNILKSIALDGQGLAGHQGSLELKYRSHQQYRVRMQRSWDAMQELSEKRRRLAAVILEVLLAHIPADAPASASQLVDFGYDELQQAIAQDLLLAAQIKDRLAAIERALMYLHEQGVIILQQGLAVFRQAMTIRILPQRRKDRFTRGDFSPLGQHYHERTFQVHVMNEYARLGATAIRQALQLVTAYFSMGKREFIRRFFPGRQDMLERATGEESYRTIVEALGNPAQKAIVMERTDRNLLVLAGPGSGKTRVVVHRCAYLLRVERIPARAILVLCFNRNAAIQLRQRLRNLVGREALGVAVMTYHALAMRLVGRSFAGALQTKVEEQEFNQLIRQAVRLLRGEEALPGLEPDEWRDRLLAGYRFILVDEYQDIDEDQYELISAIAGRTLKDPDSKLTLLAVGDDDQNIYAFRKTSVEYIRRFKADYAAYDLHLLENYRSTAHILNAAQALIEHNRERMKRGQQLVVNRARQQEHPGGWWGPHDVLTQGRVQILQVQDGPAQALAIREELRRWQKLHPELEWRQIAILARKREELIPLRAVLEAAAIPVDWGCGLDDLPALGRIREIRELLERLAQGGGEAFDEARLRALLAQCAPAPLNPWRQWLERLLDEWLLENDGEATPAALIHEYLANAILAQRRESYLGNGVFLNTAHAAKGLEFDQVIVAGGGWALRNQHPDEAEEERRLYYVAMTRARRALCLLQRQDDPNPHTVLLHGPQVLERKAEPAPDIPAAVLARRYTCLPLDQYYLSYAGRKDPRDPIHARLRALTPGAKLRLEAEGGPYPLLVTEAGQPVAALSAEGQRIWKERAAGIEDIRVIALYTQRREDSEPAYQAQCRMQSWEIPLVEIVWHGGGRLTGRPGPCG